MFRNTDKTWHETRGANKPSLLNVCTNVCVCEMSVYVPLSREATKKIDSAINCSHTAGVEGILRIVTKIGLIWSQMKDRSENRGKILIIDQKKSATNPLQRLQYIHRRNYSRNLPSKS